MSITQRLMKLAKAVEARQSRIDRWIAAAFPGWGLQRLQWRLWHDRQRKALEGDVSDRRRRH